MKSLLVAFLAAGFPTSNDVCVSRSDRVVTDFLEAKLGEADWVGAG